VKAEHLPAPGDFTQTVKQHVFAVAASTGRVPQAPAIASALDRSVDDVRAALKQLANAKTIVLASHDADIWVAPPFCAVPSAFRVDTNGRSYWGICIWDALGIVAALGVADARIRTTCGDCGEPIELRVSEGELATQAGVIHFGVPAREWWSNIGFA
jgi:hypothetical protein